MTLKEYILDDHTINGKLDKDWLEASAYDGLGYMWFGEYENFLEKWKDDDDIDLQFQEHIECYILPEIKRKGGWEYTFFENLTIDKALEISKNVKLDNNPWVADVLYKDKSLCVKYGYLAKINPRYENVARILNTIQGLIKGTCEISYTRQCNWVLEDLEEVEEEKRLYVKN